MSQRHPKHWPLTTFAVVAVLAGVAGLVLDDDLRATGRYMPMWLAYGLMVLSGLGLLAVVAHVRRKRLSGGSV
jgi:protein-S-isoprenylcysteine O-methyltransferase Ste14